MIFVEHIVCSFVCSFFFKCYVHRYGQQKWKQQCFCQNIFCYVLNAEICVYIGLYRLRLEAGRSLPSQLRGGSNLRLWRLWTAGAWYRGRRRLDGQVSACSLLTTVCTLLVRMYVCMYCTLQPKCCVIVYFTVYITFIHYVQYTDKLKLLQTQTHAATDLDMHDCKCM